MGIRTRIHASKAKPGGRAAKGRRVVRGRPPKGASGLSRSRIVDAALELIDAEGLAAVSMRSVASRLRVDAKSLYNHVDGKEGLLDAVTEHLLSTLELPALTGSFEADLANVARTFRSQALRHPQATLLVLTRPTLSTGSLLPLERILTILVDAGCSNERAVHLLRLLMATMMGTVLRDASLDATLRGPERASLERRVGQLAHSELPHVVAAAPHLMAFDSEAEFEFSLALAISAVASQVPGKQSTPNKEERG